jgi:hypothetical protein
MYTPMINQQYMRTMVSLPASEADIYSAYLALLDEKGRRRATTTRPYNAATSISTLGQVMFPYHCSEPNFEENRASTNKESHSS